MSLFPVKFDYCTAYAIRNGNAVHEAESKRLTLHESCHTTRVHGIAVGRKKGGSAGGRKEGRFPVEWEGFWLAEGTEKLERGRM